MLIAGIIVVCIILLVLAFLLPRLSRQPQKGVDKTLSERAERRRNAPRQGSASCPEAVRELAQGDEQERRKGPRGSLEAARLSWCGSRCSPTRTPASGEAEEVERLLAELRRRGRRVRPRSDGRGGRRSTPGANRRRRRRRLGRLRGRGRGAGRRPARGGRRSAPRTTSRARSSFRSRSRDAMRLAVNGARTRGLDLGANGRAPVRERRQRGALADRGPQGARPQAGARPARLRGRRRCARGLTAEPVPCRVALRRHRGLRRRGLAGDRRRAPARSAAAPRSMPTRTTAASTWS